MDAIKGSSSCRVPLQLIMQHQLAWMRVHIVRTIDIRVGIFPEMVPQDGNWHNKWDITESIVLDHLVQLRAITCIQFAFQVALDVTENIAVVSLCGGLAHNVCDGSKIFVAE